MKQPPGPTPPLRAPSLAFLLTTAAMLVSGCLVPTPTTADIRVVFLDQGRGFEATSDEPIVRVVVTACDGTEHEHVLAGEEAAFRHTEDTLVAQVWVESGTHLLDQADASGAGTLAVQNGACSATCDGPTGVELLHVGTAVQISWDPFPEALSYRVYRAEGPGAFEALASVEPGSQQFTDTSTVPGMTYRYQATATLGASEETGSCGVHQITAVPVFPAAWAALASAGLAVCVYAWSRRRP